MKNDPKVTTRQFRDVIITREAVDESARTITLAFSSELPVERYFGMEILDNTPSSVRLGRLTDGGPLLLNHDTDCQIGVVESASIDSDRVGRAVVRFGKSDEADEIFQDVLDGIRRKVSVGYQIYKMILDSREGDTDVYRITDWEPIEISIVSIPADNSVGVGRSLDELITPKKDNIMTPEEIAAKAAADASAARAAAPAVDIRAIEAAGADKENARVRELKAIGAAFAQFGGVALADQFVADRSKTAADLNAAILERAGKKAAPSGEIGMSENDKRSFSFLRVMHALANPTDRRAQEAAAFEIECSRAAADKAGKAPQGIMIPYDVLSAPSDNGKRALVTSTGSAGGYTVGTELLGASFIEILRSRLAIAQLGTTTLNGLVGNIAIPRQTGAATAYWVAEAGAPTGSQQSVDQVTMSPHTVGAYTDFSRKLLIQSSVDVEMMVRGDLTAVIARAIDLAGFYGLGAAGQPMGLRNVTGLQTQTFAAAIPTFAEVIAMETKIAVSNADVGNMSYITSANQRGNLKSAPKVTGYPDFIWNNGEMNGYKGYVSNQITNNDIWFGNWADLVIGFWSGLDLMVDPYSNSTSGTVRIVALQDTDVAVRHPVSFCRGNTAGNLAL